jgi:hypothetical protein
VIEFQKGDVGMNTNRLLVLLAGGVLACSSGKQSPSEGAAYPPEVYDALPDAVAAPATTCFRKPEEMGFCVWAGAADRIIWGKVTEVSLTSYPAVMPTGKEEPAWGMIESGCEHIVPALQLRIRVEKNLFGSGEEELTVHFGAEQVGRFSPNPDFDSTGRIRWGTGESGAEPRKGIAVGTQLGLAVRYLPNVGLWSATGEPLFALTEAGTLTAQKVDECVIFPSVLYGGTFSALESAIAACSPDDLSAPATLERKRLVALGWGEDAYPAQSYAPICADGLLPTAQ